MTLDREIDVARGDMIVRRMNQPRVANRLDAALCWMDEHPGATTSTYILKHTTRSVRAHIERIVYKIDVDTLHRMPADALRLNDIGRVEITTAAPLFIDPYKINRTTGSFILIDPQTNNTVAAGMIRGSCEPVRKPPKDTPAKEAGASRSPDVVWRAWNIPRATREQRNGHGAAVLWLTGLSGAGKSTIARRLESRLFHGGMRTMLLDGDQLRHGLCGDLGFSEGDRQENIRRAGETARLFFEAGHIVICAFISPFARDRQKVRALFPGKRFFEVHVRCDLATCMERDPNGLYKKALAGKIARFTGLDSPYEAPPAPEIVVDTDRLDTDGSVALLMDKLTEAGIIRDDTPA
jgi:bifunctional enzyme CysN/CysC